MPAKRICFRTSVDLCATGSAGTILFGTVANYATGEGNNTLSKSAMKKGGAKKCLNCVESKCQDDEGCLIFLQPQISLQCQSLAHIHTYV